MKFSKLHSAVPTLTSGDRTRVELDLSSPGLLPSFPTCARYLPMIVSED
jgi:hypothetical protein